VESPAQRAAETAAPAARPVTAAVTRGALQDTLQARADVARSVSDSLVLSTGGQEPAVVTAAPAPMGSTARAGGVALEVDGRPVFLLPGAFPFYRDLGPGDSGPDVSQLQRALGAAGLPVAAAEAGRLGPRTVAAVGALYRRAGYRPAAQPVVADQAAPATTTPSAPPADPTVPATVATPTTELIVPRAELLVAPHLDAVVTATPAVGTLLDGSARIVLSTGDLVARVHLASGSSGAVAVGLTTTLTSDDGRVVAGHVAAPPVTRQSGDGQAGEQVDVLVVADAGALPADWAGTDIAATITLSTVATDALLVPSRAVASTRDGGTRVLRQLPDGSFTPVPVTRAGSLGGLTAVTPAGTSVLSDHDRVRVG
jgi:hypothetical protein